MKIALAAILLTAGSSSRLAAAADTNAAPKAGAGNLIDHGVVARVSESRGVLATRDKSGVPLIAAFARDQGQSNPRTSLLIIDARTGKSEQYWYPKRDYSNGDLFQSMLASSGRIYATIGHTFLEFDVEKREWTFTGKTDGMAMSFAESPDGLVYFGTYPDCSLYRFDPKTRKLDKLGRLDPKEAFPYHLAASDDGWVYAGIGTARSNLVAFDTKTGKAVQLAGDDHRKSATSGWVIRGNDGKIYGRASTASGSPLFRLEGGRALGVPSKPFPAAAKSGVTGWSSVLRDFPGGGKIVSFDMPGKYAMVELDGSKQRIEFDYESYGAGISSLALGPDGKLYGSTYHPMRFFSFDRESGKISDYGAIRAIGGGNFPALAVSGNYVVGDSYPEGAVYEFDTGRPWEVDDDGRKPVNPRLLGKLKEVSRPRAAVTLPNGDILFGGYGGYGVTGGGLVIYDAASRKVRAKPSSEVIPNQSPVMLSLLDEKTVIGGTSIDAPGGGRVLAKQAKLFLFDIATQKVTFQVAPVEGARSIFALEPGPDGKVYGITSESQFFVFDPKSRTVVHREDWRKWGEPFNPGHSLFRGPNGRIHALLAKGVLEVQPDYSVRKVADLPVRPFGGGVVLSDRVYFVSGPHLYSIALRN